MTTAADSPRIPKFRYDPADMDRLRSELGRLPEVERFHDFELRRVEIGPSALGTLPGILDELAPDVTEVVVVQDATPMVRDGKDLKRAVADLLTGSGRTPDVVVLEAGEDGAAHADEHTVEQVKAHLKPGVPVVSVGSGTVTDVAKHACYLFEGGQDADRRLPLVFVATANTMVAYSARMAVIARHGVKRTSASRLSDVLVMDTTVLRDAPPESGLAGIGDAAAMYVSFGDWWLGRRFGLGNYLEASSDLIADVREYLLPYARRMADRTPEGLEVQSRLMVLCGLTATIAGESAPLSGYEHVVSHMLDMSAAHYDRPVGTHGAQVGMAVAPCSIAFNLLIDELDPEQVDIDACFPEPEVVKERILATFAELDPSGAMGEECWRDYSRKLEGWHKARGEFESFLANWPEERDRLRALVPSAEECVEALVTAGLPLRFEDLPTPIPEEQARWAFANGHLMRNRFSSADLLNFLGWMDDAFAERVFTRMQALAARAVAKADEEQA
jgi:glycerol-1-phosphate dehydrogenase [NAD(P)+]